LSVSRNLEDRAVAQSTETLTEQSQTARIQGCKDIPYPAAEYPAP
jgi:hypothetical protein